MIDIYLRRSTGCRYCSKISRDPCGALCDCSCHKQGDCHGCGKFTAYPSPRMDGMVYCTDCWKIPTEEELEELRKQRQTTSIPDNDHSKVPKVGEIYQHREKNGVYEIKGVGRHERTGVQQVSYADSTGELWFRDLEGEGGWLTPTKNGLSRFILLKAKELTPEIGNQ